MGGGLGGGLGPQGGFIARLRARRQVLDATAADLAERGLQVPRTPMSRQKIFAVVVASALLLGLLVGLTLYKRLHSANKDYNQEGGLAANFVSMS
jgi:hypothetical protein